MRETGILSSISFIWLITSLRMLGVVSIFFLSIFLPSLAMANRTIILVHGAFVGGWYWAPVAIRLQELGHDVTALDLKGHGQRAFENGPNVTIFDHVDDIVNEINMSPQPVILVAHSYGGRPATGAWDRVREKIGAIIFIEAVAPYGNGANALPFEHRERMTLAELDPAAVALGLLDPPSYLVTRYPTFSIVAQSLDTLHGAVPLSRGPLPDTPGAYILGSKSSARVFRRYAERVAKERGWTVWEIDTGHDVVFDNADVVARLINKLAMDLTISLK